MLAEIDRRAEPTMQLAATWLAMVPLFFFACRGILWFQATGNNAGGGFSSISGAKGVGDVEVIGTAFFCVFLLLMTRVLSIVEMCWRNRVFLVLALYALASCAWSQFPSLSLQFGIYIVLNVLFVFYLYSRYQPHDLMQVFVSLGWIVIPASIIFAVAFPQYGVDHRRSTAGAWQGIFVFKNTCSIMCTFLLSAIFYVRADSPSKRFLRFVYIFLTIFLVLMTRARTGWIVMLSLFACVAAMEMVRRFKGRERFMVVVLLSTVSIFAAVGIALYYRQILLLIGKDPTLTGRTEIWNLVLNSAMKRPLLGYGYRAFWSGLRGESANITLMEQWTVPGAHDGLLEVWLDLGLVGLSIALFTVVRALRDGVTCLRFSDTPRVRWYVSILVITIVSNVAEMTIMFPNYLTWMMYILACVGLADEAKKIRNRSAPA